MGDQEEELMRLRDRIDTLDGKIIELISSRAAAAQEVGRVKEVAGVANAFFYRPEREAQVLRRIIACNDGPLDDETMARLFREIMSACLALEGSACEEDKTSIVDA
ncbi:MAG: chorismate mutase [Endozoicomonadaceae bacterium]|nr:chorismate mutase [Endozoicomonadaceae bacterium]